VEVCPNEQGNRITPSYVAWSQGDGQRLVGDAAKNQVAVNPSNTVFDVKRLIGRKFSDPSVQKDSKLFPYKSNYLFFLPWKSLILMICSCLWSER
jgi:molecular chaperone DnaK (HSP70)